jgi:Icc-related predicted phosphoesterase
MNGLRARIRRRSPPQSVGECFRVYYASDIHGSERCWRKFLNAAAFYRADALIMGGDLTGKGLVPVIATDEGRRAHVLGEERHARTPEQLAELLEAIKMNGWYPWETSEQDVASMSSDASFAERTFEQLMLAEMQRWVVMADERLGATDVRAYVMPGNDDPWAIDPVLADGTAVIACDGRIVAANGHELLSFGYSNRTPWDSPRELDEEELYRALRGLADQLTSPSTAIFNLHVPPYGTGVDTAYELDDTLRPVTIGGQPHEIPVGSTAVRQIIEEVQPLLSLHGHVHESRGIVKLGRTTVINPGSEYNSGRIHGCIVELAGASVRSRQLVTG